MRLLLNFTIFTCLSVLFFSCNTDSPTDPSGDANYYNWTVIPVAMDTVSKVSAANGDIAFIGGNSSYRVSGSEISRINFQDSSFRCYGVDAYDKDNAVFWGFSTSAPGATFKVYADGNFTTYNSGGSLPQSKIIFINKNKFYYNSDTDYYLFDNGVCTAYTGPAAESIKGFGKVGESIYLFTTLNASSFSQSKAYRLLSSNDILLISSVPEQGRIQFLNNDVLRITQDSTIHIIDYYNGANWINLYSFTTPAYDHYIQYAAGNSKEQFLTVWFDWNVNAYCDVYSAGTRYLQTNFPTGAITINIPAIRTVSNYADNSYYIIDRYHPTKLVKGKLK